MSNRRKRNQTRKMPETLTLAEVTAIYRWPLGSVKTKAAAGENWTDCLIEVEPRIRLGGRYNTRRVRYDGRFYVVHNHQRVYLAGALALEVLEVAAHVYGRDAACDIFYNKVIKGY